KRRVSIDNQRWIVATPAGRDEDVVIAEIGAGCPGLHYKRTLVAARIVVGGGSDCEVGLLRRAIHEAICQCNGIRISIVKSIDRQSDLASLLVFKAPVYEVVVGISS